MPDQPEYTGPSDETLSRLAGMLPDMVKGVATKKLYGRGMKASPSKLCNVCNKAFGVTVRMENQPIIESLCDRCRSMLQQGYVALLFGDKFRFAKVPQWPDRAGQIVPVTSQKMWDGIEACFKANFAPDEPGDEPAPA